MKSRAPFYIVCIIATVTMISNAFNQAHFNALKKDFDALASQHQDLQEEYSYMLDEVIRLEEENGIFTSMLGEIESQPGGSEILKTLFDKHSDNDR